jgi:hypothetical protein
LQSHTRGAAGINVESMRSADITPELTGRGRKASNLTARKDDESDAISRSG